MTKLFATATTSSSEQQTPERASAVVAVVLRVAGPVITEVRTHGIGTPDAQVCVRIGDALLYLTEPRLVARIRQQWDASQYLATQRLPKQVPQAWLESDTDVSPVGVTLQLTGPVKVAPRYQPPHRGTRTPPHLRMCIDRLVWQVCDLTALAIHR